MLGIRLADAEALPFNVARLMVQGAQATRPDVAAFLRATMDPDEIPLEANMSMAEMLDSLEA